MRQILKKFTAQKRVVPGYVQEKHFNMINIQGKDLFFWAFLQG